MEKITQEERILQKLIEADGKWVDGQYFLRTMWISQYHRAIWNLQNRRVRYNYAGTIEVSDFTDEYGFKSYRLKVEVEQPVLI